jgi:hypothetical protein
VRDAIGQALTYRGKFMNARDCLVSLGAVAVLVLAMTGSAGGAECQFRMGPYTSQSMAELGMQQARDVGLKTSSIWGEGGGVSRPANDKYFFNVLFACS